MKKVLFLKAYRLEDNPFSADRLRPVYRSLSYEYASRKIAQLLSGKLHCLLISGPPGVGKTLLLEKELQPEDELYVCRIEPRQEDVTSLLQRLLAEIGPGTVDGTTAELRNILHVFLRHQAARGRRCLVVADGVDQDSVAVIREIEEIARLRLRGVPVCQLLLTTRNEEIVERFRGRNESSMRPSTAHQRHTGLTREETGAYLRSSLLGAGCEWFDELIPAELIVEIQAFTQGIPGDIDALLRLALQKLSNASTGSIRQQGLDVGMLKASAKQLNLRYNSAAWKIDHEEILSPSAVRQSRRKVLRIEAASLAVTSGGRMIAEVTLDRPRMVLGRDESCDISLDSSYVSRYQNLFMATSEGWVLIDLKSPNGCFVNGRKVSEHKLRDGDLITLGQHHIRFSGGPVEYPNPDGAETMATPPEVLN